MIRIILRDGINEHDYPLWQKNWKILFGGKKDNTEGVQINLFGSANRVSIDDLQAGAPKVRVSTGWVWPSKEQFKSADLIVVFSVVNWSKERNSEFPKYLSRGGGFVTIQMICVVAQGIDLDDEGNDLCAVIHE